ncbi:hypothetical protein M9H77_23381 [Catharanthus roseus]|uniref:Uncharacterized protein n=1 Tax=Catharanthus roseus TaxID=4058 RepID=A0ACC0AX94_CATRO|nr:hypothetical protein M9H77_23381 [Catharanthus roseus]
MPSSIVGLHPLLARRPRRTLIGMMDSASFEKEKSRGRDMKEKRLFTDHVEDLQLDSTRVQAVTFTAKSFAPEVENKIPSVLARISGGLLMIDLLVFW